ncbi:hypothetical protein [Vibrio tritonius]|uniref:hypothetical protein n=1 Tax=Vibrio tritonius TaxID=1435069 RepID=UPI000AECF758|nr:hypothetical protein [Vibrio tritonius]
MYLSSVSHPWRLLTFSVMLSVLFAGAYVPAVGQAAGPWHFELHFLAFGLVGVVTTWALSRLSWRWHCLLIVMIPLGHEICEIWGHHHGLETMDVMVDILGGLTGILLAQILMRVGHH